MREMHSRNDNNKNNNNNNKKRRRISLFGSTPDSSFEPGSPRFEALKFVTQSQQKINTMRSQLEPETEQSESEEATTHNGVF